MSLDQFGLQDKDLLSKVYETFNAAIEKLRKHQVKLETQVQDLSGELSKKNEELSDILESLSVGLIVTDLSGKIIRCNRSALRLIEMSEEASVGQNINSLFDQQVLPSLLEADGLKQIDVNYPQEIIKTRANQEKLTLATSTSLMKSMMDDQPYGIIINIEDITLLKRLQEDAERKNRLTAMGEIAANVAHEIRNPLGSIELFISMLRKDLEGDEEKSEAILRIQSGIRSMNHIISNLLE